MDPTDSSHPASTLSADASPTGTAPPVAWHALTPEAALGHLASGRDGLSSEEAARRLAVHGRNALPAPPRRSAWRRLAAQFDNVLIHVLLASAVVTALLGHPIDSAVILLVVAINAIVGFLQEGKAERALEAIRDLLMPHAAAMRDGRRVSVDAATLVPGDIVLLEPGDRVPADLRLLRARGLRIDEAMLTGESVPAEKEAAAVEADAAIGDRACMAYSGTLVATGTASGVVVATGQATELGRIGRLLGSVEPITTPLLRQMDHFARRLTAAILAASAVIFLFGVTLGGMPTADAFLAVVGIAVASIPEGLPAVMTIALALGVQRMARRNAIVRRLPAVETLGAVSVICTDKTGTLTRNEMTVRGIETAAGRYVVDGTGYDPVGGFRRRAEDGSGTVTAMEAPPPDLAALAIAAMLCNDAALHHTGTGWRVEGDPMEGALVVAGMKAGFDPAALAARFPRQDEIPFDARHRFMATLHHGEEGERFICLKGAPERVLELCTAERGSGGDGSADRPLDHARWERAIATMAADGQRVLAVAMRDATGASALDFEGIEAGGFVLLGLLGLIDPPRAEAIAAVADCRSAGIRVKMITGDHGATAAAIARQIGLENPDDVVTGADIDAVDDARLPALARRVDVFARTAPEHKLRLVAALQAEGAVVAMTGDGVNDAPALKRADIGVAMGGKGTEAAKQAAEMVLADDNFASIAAAVREGRTVYDNVRKTIAWTLPTNGGEALCVVLAILCGLTLPITPVQILWINMATTITLGLTLAFEPSEPGVMRRPPRRSGEPLISRFLLWRVVFVSALFAAGAFGIFAWGEARGLPLEATRTMVVDTIVAFEIAYLFTVRFRHMTSLTWRGALGTPAVLAALAGVTVLQLLFTYAPFMQGLFDTRPLGIAEVGMVLGAGAALFAILEIEKLIGRRLSRLPG